MRSAMFRLESPHVDGPIFHQLSSSNYPPPSVPKHKNPGNVQKFHQAVAPQNIVPNAETIASCERLCRHTDYDLTPINVSNRTM